MSIFDFVGDVLGGATDDLLGFTGGGKDVANTNLRLSNYATNLNYTMWQKSQEANQDAFNRTMRYQDALNRNQIKWRVADAKQSGLHPLAALGVNPASGPSAQSFSPGAVDAPQLSPESPSSFGGMGQNISNSIFRAMTKKERRESEAMAVFNRERDIMLASNQIKDQELDLQYKEMRNAQIASDIKLKSGTQAGPPNVVPDVVVAPNTVEPVASNPGRTPGAISDYQYARTKTGLIVVPSENMKQRIEDQPDQQIGWFWRNGILPFFNAKKYAPTPPSVREVPPPKGYYWGAWNGTEFPLKRIN